MKRWALLGLVATIACGREERPAAVAPAPEAPSAAAPEGRLPDDFPGDVPVYDDARPLSSMASAEQGTVVNLRSADPADAIFAWYRKRYPQQGWTIEYASETRARSTLVARKGNRVSSVVIQPVPGSTQVLLLVAEDR